MRTKRSVHGDERPRSGYVFTGAYWYGLDCANTAMVFALLAKTGNYSEKIVGATRGELVDKTVRLIRYLCFTHDTGPVECVRVNSHNLACSGKKWGERGLGFFRESQCGNSVFPLGYAAWLLWDGLDIETKLMVQDVLFDFADRFSRQNPHNGAYYDTQTEENGWTAKGISIAAYMFPGHPNAGEWREACRRWAANTAAINLDRFNKPEYAGELAGLFTSVTSHPDFTAAKPRICPP